jgi:predicted GIY-YIG superfamily endonuclease
MTRHYLYLLCESDTGECKYVGVTKNPKARLAASGGTKNLLPWTNAVKARGASIRMSIVAQYESKEECARAERQAIAERWILGVPILNVH